MVYFLLLRSIEQQRLQIIEEMKDFQVVCLFLAELGLLPALVRRTGVNFEWSYTT